jgi:parvulin-like peptidyl-prolyl isomerase/G:T/U-mismatch repair DNA glycosylase
MLLACGAPPDESTIATFDGGRITADDIDRALLGLPASQVQSLDVEQLEQLVRRLAMQQYLLAEARRLGLDQQPDHLALREELRREAIVAIYLERHPDAPGPPTDEELQAYYDEHVSPSRGRRVVYHLFKRYPSDQQAARDQVKAEVAELRQRVVQGEPFPALAAAHSDSESRHYEGLLGIIEQGQLPPQLDEVVFSLEENVPSQPLATSDGVHLFWVETAMPARTFALDELRGQIVTTVQTRKSQALITELVSGWQDEVTVQMAEPEELRQILAGDDAEATVLAVGDYQLAARDLRRMLRRSSGQAGQQPAARVRALLESLRRREIICQHLLREGLADTGEAERRAAQRADNELAARYLEQQISELVDQQPERIEAFYERSKMRYASPLQLQIRRLVVPLGPDPSQRMASLEAACPALDQGDQTLDRVAAELSGELEKLPWHTLPELQRIEPKVVVLAGSLAAGQHSSPYRTESGLEIIQVLDRREPQVRPLAEVKRQVKHELLASQSQELYGELEQQLLDRAGLAILPERLQALLATGFGSIEPDPTPGP